MKIPQVFGKISRINGRFSSRKIFCIGLNKTGTTSLKYLFALNGWTISHQRVGEALFPAYMRGDFQSVVSFVDQNKANFYQDAPFSFPETWKHIYSHFPDAIYILTVRSSFDEFYQSRIRFDQKILGCHETPTWHDLENFPGGALPKGALATFYRDVVGCKSEPYEKANWQHHYQNHNTQVMDFFADKPHQFGTINLSRQSDSLVEINRLLKPMLRIKEIPHMNKSK